MEGIENRLQSSSSTTVVQIFSKIVENIRTKHKDGQKDFPELKFLKEKCLSSDPLISEVAGKATIQLVEDRILPAESTLADFISATTSTKCYSSLTNLLGDLLLYKMKTTNSCSDYNLCSPQHPFITLLSENSSNWNFVLNKMKSLEAHQNDLSLNELFRPVYLFCLYYPSSSMNLFKHRLWTFLLSPGKLEKDVFLDVLCWLQIQTRDHIELTSELLDEALTVAATKRDHCLNLDLLILWQATVLYHLAVNKLELSSTISTLKRVLQRETYGFFTTNSLLLIFSRVVDICIPTSLKDMLDLCQLLVHQASADTYILDTLRSSLLQWLASPCLLLEDAYILANDIFVNASQRKTPPTESERSLLEFQSEITSNSVLFTSLAICHLAQQLKDETELSTWLDQVHTCPDGFINELFHFLCGLLMTNTFTEETTMKIFAITLKHAEKNIVQTPKLLVIILYNLSNTEHPRLRFALLEALPKMVVCRENVPKVMSTLKAVSSGSETLFNVALRLMYDAWTRDGMCYTYLEVLLVTKDVVKKKWERYVTKSHVIRELCLAKPELYGKDMVAHLSKILNECHDDNGSLPSALAIEAITTLCRAEVIDVVTTWVTLAPKFKHDLRLPVVKSLCSLIREIPQLSYTETHPDLYRDVMCTLWGYVETGDADICEAAFDSLASFGLEQICAHLPEEFLEEDNAVAQPSKGVTKQLLVPGKTWIDFLMKKCASQAAVNFLIKMISIEIDGYLKYVYQMKGNKEPLNYGYLPTHSVLRGVGEFVKSWSNKWRNSIHDKLYIECLHILSTEFNKPLPPLDWCFLQELMHDKQTKRYCVDIASHQVVISGTARRLVENYINAVTQNPQDEDIDNVFRNLKYLANSIQPVILKPFFEAALWSVIKKCEANQERTLFDGIMDSLKAVLKHAGVQETNKMAILQVLNGIIFVTAVESDLFEALMQTITSAPTKCFESIVNLKSNSSEDWVKKVLKMHCYLAKISKVSPLNWLNDVIDVSSQQRNQFFRSEIDAVFKSHVNNSEECALWLLDLIGQIQARVADRCKEVQLMYLFDIFVLAVVRFSGLDAFMNPWDNDERIKELFPQALVALLHNDGWSICTVQVLEWLYHMNSEVTVPEDYRKLFGLSLRALRHDTEFTKHQKWMKYLNCVLVFQ